MSTREVTRRAVLAGACSTCAVAAAGCASYTTGRPAPTTKPPAQVAAGSGLLPGNANASATVLAAAKDIPVGGAKIFPEQGVVVSQPVANKFVAFSTTCTHQGCAVNAITGKTVNCPCHGSKFAVADRSVVHGPTVTPLPKMHITVTDGQIRLA